ncbi:Thiamin pyrophosphokinase [Microdochium bolleyi]|uniref:Thiamin pyrophosphokinase n=1 Tax=Microdochium bolleyi TaxID=196109 RepID=A0A136IWH5_9PEZI|nr:Thiamin pyrophosphokinase [Microdochium bolleyi]
MATAPEAPSTGLDSSAEVVKWHLPRIVRPSDFPGHDYALVILNQPIDNEPLFAELWKHASSRVAADGGANRVLQLHKRKLKQTSSHSSSTPTSPANGQQPELYTQLDAIIGDLDSLSDEAREFFSPASDSTEVAPQHRTCRIIHDPDQYSTDFTKAVDYVRNGSASSAPAPMPAASSSQQQPPLPRDTVCLGGLGGRVDQGVSQLHHLYLFQQEPGSYERDGRIFLLSEEGLTFLLQGGKTHRIRVREAAAAATHPAGTDIPVSARPSAFAKHVGILPLREPSVISTRGFEWDVQDWRTELGGQLSTSNHVVEDVVEVWTSKDVLFTIALRRKVGYDEQEDVPLRRGEQP